MGQKRGTLHVAAVMTVDGVRFAAAEPTRDALLAALGRYVAASAPDALWPEDASEVSERIVRGEIDDAIEVYFAAAGCRWDDEWLVTLEVATGEARPSRDLRARAATRRRRMPTPRGAS